MKVMFAGSPAPAVPVLGALLASRHEVALVITREDRPRGRGRQPVPTPVGQAAEDAGIPLLKPASINAPESLDVMRATGGGALVVAAFGQILRDDVLDGWPCINVHYSLLPAYRGAAPVERALMDGVTETGTTIMLMDAGLDTGPIIESVPVPLARDDDAGSLLMKMAEASGPALVRALDALEAGSLASTPQPGEGAGIAAKITDEDRPIDPRRTAVEIRNQVRALSPHIGATLGIDGQVFKVWRVKPTNAAAVPGLVRDSGRMVLGTASGGLEIVELQPPGKGRMHADAFLRGYRGDLALTS
ncbi:MAG: methionyl-tRNA formyltransferase [Thermoleophilia bacterium]|nr:methionyl-tRNA formyltransferase [Thermoleophilia bacterium]